MTIANRKVGLFVPLLAVVAAQSVALLAQERLPPIPPEKMTAEQKKVAAEYKAVRGTEMGAGPFGVLLRVPDLVVPSVQIRLHNQKNSAFSQKLTEMAILIAARHYNNNYEWNSHSASGAKAGVDAKFMAALVDGRRPERMSEEEAILYDFCAELNEHQSVSDATYARALAKFGEAGVVEAASLEGYYAYLAMVMNVARTPVPAGAKPQLKAFPQN